MKYQVNNQGDFFLLKDEFGFKTNEEIPSIEDYKYKFIAYDDDKNKCGEGFFNEWSEETFDLLLVGVAAQWGAVHCKLYNRDNNNYIDSIG